jgi:hypothetical protein
MSSPHRTCFSTEIWITRSHTVSLPPPPAAGNALSSVERSYRRTLIEAIAKGHRWQTQLESGEYASLEDLAKDVGCDRTYVGRMLRLTSLAPDIIEAILRGDEPDGLSLEKLRKHLPLRWDEQREVWR